MVLTHVEAPNTKKDLRNEFFVEFWSYDNKGFSIRTFSFEISGLAFARDVSEHRSRDLLKNSSRWTFKAPLRQIPDDCLK